MRKNGTGPFVACTSHPECDFIRSQVFPSENEKEELIEDKILGKDENNQEIILKKGPYGPYVQLGSKSDNKEKIKRASVPKSLNLIEIDISVAKKLLELPREVGNHPETGKPIVANNGRYGPYIKYDNVFYSLPKDESPLTVGINRAIDIIATPKKRSRQKANALKVIGKHPKGNEEISLYKGRFGYYLKSKNINYSISKTIDIEKLSIEDAIKIIDKKNKGNS